jgi:hypothetical protein
MIGRKVEYMFTYSNMTKRETGIILDMKVFESNNKVTTRYIIQNNKNEEVQIIHPAQIFN